MRRVVEIQNLLINVGSKKIPVASCAISNADKMRRWMQRLDMGYLTLHAIEKRFASLKIFMGECWDRKFTKLMI